MLTWIVLIIATVLAMRVMPNAILIGVFGFRVFIDSALQAVCFGIIIGLVTREIQLKNEAKNSM